MPGAKACCQRSSQSEQASAHSLSTSAATRVAEATASSTVPATANAMYSVRGSEPPEPEPSAVSTMNVFSGPSRTRAGAAPGDQTTVATAAGEPREATVITEPACQSATAKSKSERFVGSVTPHPQPVQCSNSGPSSWSCAVCAPADPAEAAAAAAAGSMVQRWITARCSKGSRTVDSTRAPRARGSVRRLASQAPHLVSLSRTSSPSTVRFERSRLPLYGVKVIASSEAMSWRSPTAPQKLLTVGVSRSGTASTHPADSASRDGGPSSAASAAAV